MATSPTQFPWQIINKTTVLKKGRGYFNIWPIIGSTVTPYIYKGVPQIFLQYNYTATRNFSIGNVIVDPLLKKYVNYDLVIRHNNFDGTITRYKLWPFTVAGGEFLVIPQYSGQVIKKNFSIELWAVNPYGTGNILEDLFNTVRFDTEADAYGKIYYHDGGVADISQSNDIADFRLTTEGQYYYYFDPNDNQATIYLDNGGDKVPNGTVFLATASVGLVSPLNTVSTTRIIHVADPAIASNQALTDGVAQFDCAQTKVNISLLKEKLTLTDPDEYEETTVSSVPCTVLNRLNHTGEVSPLPIPFIVCSAGLPNN